MNNELDDDYGFMTSAQISKTIAKKIKAIRKKRFKTQELFAEHIGISFSKYARFEKTGHIQFPDFIEVVKGIDRIDELEGLFEKKVDVITW